MTAPSFTPAPALPWRVTDLTRLFTGNCVGLALTAVGWFGASGTVRGTQQVEWAALSVLGLVVAGTANGLWIVNGRRSIGLRRSAVTTGVAQLLQELAARDGEAAATVPTAASEQLVGRLGSALTHRGDCQLVAGKADVRPLTEAETFDRRVCGVCAP